MGLWTRLRLTRHPDGTSPSWGIAILVAGIVLVLFGWLWEGTWEDVFIEVGAASGVGGIVLLFKPRLMRQVDERTTDVATKTATTTAEEIASTRTEEIEKRLIRLERVSDIQARERDRLHEEAERIIAAVEGDTSFSSLNELLDHASEQGLFAESMFIKTSDDLGQPLLQVSQDIYNTNPFTRMMSFEILVLTEVDFIWLIYSKIEDGAVQWVEGDSFDEFVRELYAVFARANLPHDKLSLQKSLTDLQESHRLMVEARQAAEGSSNRLHGRLRLLINDEWVLTDAGLEGTKSDLIFPWRSIGQYGEHLERTGDFGCPPNCQEHLWDEAKTYAGRLAI
ncbi:MAG: hypothetical protein OXH38_06135 [Chloroflexi bacterium]|nr:hypothetical protein [Chloroflexota bacterium]